MEINQDRIKQTIEKLHQKKPGEILSSEEIYQAIAHEQYKEDHKEAVMELGKKTAILKGLDTKSIIGKLHQYEDGLEKAMLTEADFKNSNP
ncbi:unnamed protein product [marine sediment metagenome]|uniref:Uncharacterized protein n=1 Tax=marine sediment metagenome TaxID=412755 RepID=X1NQC3_9ZZZZ